MSMRIDAHQHYWKIERGDYAWMGAPEVASLRRDYLPLDLAPHLAQHEIDGTIVVQAAATTAETDFLLRLASEEPTISGVVGWLDLEAEDFPAQLAGYAGKESLVGIRPMLQDLPDDRFVLQPRVLKNLELLAAAGLRLDLLVHARHLPHVAEALGKVPDLVAVIDHCAKPDLRGGDLGFWREHMSRLAEESSVRCKLSGLVTEAPPGAGAEQLAPAIEHVYSAFGPDRLLFGSDWPVCTLSASYERVVSLLREALGERLTGEAEQKIFGGNALQFYGLESG